MPGLGRQFLPQAAAHWQAVLAHLHDLNNFSCFAQKAVYIPAAHNHEWQVCIYVAFVKWIHPSNNSTCRLSQRSPHSFGLSLVLLCAMSDACISCQFGSTNLKQRSLILLTNVMTWELGLFFLSLSELSEKTIPFVKTLLAGSRPPHLRLLNFAI